MCNNVYVSARWFGVFVLVVCVLCVNASCSVNMVGSVVSRGSICPRCVWLLKSQRIGYMKGSVYSGSAGVSSAFSILCVGYISPWK